jgi:D-amino peptidase
MKILISADIEGVAGVFHTEQTRAGNGEYERARAWMTAEANAAVQGAFAGGATEVLVNDSHGGFRNLLPDQIDPRAQLVLGKPRYLSMMAGVEHDCDGVFMIGYHSRAQGRGVLAHTINSSAFARVWFNGLELGEAGIYAALAGEFDVPVLLASGDDVFIAETQPLMPWVRYVQTKTAGGQGSGTTLSPTTARDAIAHAAEAVTRNAIAHPEARCLELAGPVNCRLQTMSSAYADLFCQWPTFERVDGVTLAFTAPTVQAAVRMLNCCSAMAFMLK